jgi:hypothetical protein
VRGLMRADKVERAACGEIDEVAKPRTAADGCEMARAGWLGETGEPNNARSAATAEANIAFMREFMAYCRTSENWEWEKRTGDWTPC